MDPQLATLAAIVAKNEQILAMSLADLDDARFRTPAIPGTSSMAWILGHLANSRVGACRLLGAAETYAHAELFARGSRVTDPAALPAMDELVRDFSAAGARLGELMAATAADSLAAPGPEKVPSTDGTVLGTLTFLMIHECYHLGQLGLIRRAHGLTGIA